MSPPAAATDAGRATTVGALLRIAEERLRRGAVDAPRVQATALLGHALALDRAALLARLQDPVAPASARRVESLVARRMAHEPLQYLIGRASFLDFEVRVGPGVFIPRPETEQLVDRALRAWRPDRPWAIDLCSGSGAIAIALARARPDARVIALELSPVALASARRSASDAGVEDRVYFVRSDLLAALRPPNHDPRQATRDRGQVTRDRWPEALEERLGLLVSNPPYAAEGDVVQPEVRDHEPRSAWEAGPSGLEIYRRLIPEAAALLPAGCPMLLELGYGQERQVPELLRRDGNWSAATIEADFQAIPRVLTCRRT